MAGAGVAGWVRKNVGEGAKLRIVLILAGVFALDTADKAAISAVAGGLKSQFQIGNVQIGMLIAAVSFVGAIAALPAGLLVDRFSRRKCLMVAIGLWSVAMPISGAAPSFLWLLGARVFLGAVSAMASPAVASLTGDFFHPQERANIYGRILAGELIGTGAGFLLGGLVSSWFNWRWPFYLLFIPGALLVWLIHRFLEEPERGGKSRLAPQSQDGEAGGRSSRNEGSAEGGTAEPKIGTLIHDEELDPRPGLVIEGDPARWSLVKAIVYALRIPSYRLFIIASSLGYFFFSGIRAFAMIFFTARYGLSRGTLSFLILPVGAAALIGVLLGARISGWLLSKRHAAGRVEAAGGAMVVAGLVAIPTILVRSPFVGIPLLCVTATALAAANPPLDAARLDIMHASLWGRAEAGRMAIRSALEGGAPLLFGVLSNWLGGGTAGLKFTFLVMTIPLLLAGLLAIPARRRYPRDVATAIASMSETAKAHADGASQ